MSADILITDNNGDFHVFLSPDGDHIVTRMSHRKTGEESDVMLPHGSWAWDRAVERARRGIVFL